MRKSGLNISEALAQAKGLLESPEISASIRALISLLVSIIELLTGKLNTDSTNSSLPPSQDPHRVRGSKRRGVVESPKRKPGGQVGHKGETLEMVGKPDVVEDLPIDRRTLPHGHIYKQVDCERRQVIDIEISRKVTEYRAEIVEDECGNRYVAEFPDGVTRPVQYGASVKAEIVYQSAYQLIPLRRVQEYLRDRAQIEISTGTIQNVRRDCYKLLEGFEEQARSNLHHSPLVHFDETGVNINGKIAWLHNASNAQWTLQIVHDKRGTEGIEALGVLPGYEGIACHDHWKPYFQYSDCLHVLFNSHHNRELESAIENEQQKWASALKDLLETMYIEKTDNNGEISKKGQAKYRQRYREIISCGLKECTRVERKAGQRGRVKQTKARNLLERLRDYEDETLRFITSPDVPFTNNQAERDQRMTKVQQKISGCFRSMEGAKIHCRIRSFLSSAMKQGMTPTMALSSLFQHSSPQSFIDFFSTS